MLDGIGRLLPPELGFPIEGVLPPVPFPPGNHDPPNVGPLLDGRNVGGGVFPLEGMMLLPPDKPGNLPVWLLPKLGLNFGLVIVPNPWPLEGLPMLVEFEPPPKDGLLGVNLPKPPLFPEVELPPRPVDVPNLLLLVELGNDRLPLLRDELEEVFFPLEKLRGEPFELLPPNCANAEDWPATRQISEAAISDLVRFFIFLLRGLIQ